MESYRRIEIMEMREILVIQATEVRVEWAEPFRIAGLTDIFDNIIAAMYLLATDREVRSMPPKSIEETTRPNVIGSERPSAPTICTFFGHSPSNPLSMRSAQVRTLRLQWRRVKNGEQRRDYDADVVGDWQG